MKQFFTLIVLVSSLAVSAVAQWGPNNRSGWNQSRFSVTSLANRSIRVMINGQWIQGQGNEVRINNLNPGNYRIQIYENRQGRDWDNRDRNDRDRDDRSGRGWGSNRNGNLIYNANLTIRQGMHVDIVVNRFGRVFVDEQPVSNRWDDDVNGGWNGGGWNNNGWQQGMDATTFERLREAVRRESFDEKRISTIKTVLPNSGTTSAQVRELMQLMSFEQNKLELAKYAYRFTVDRDNYFTVNDVLSFANSRNELNRFIRSYKD